MTSFRSLAPFGRTTGLTTRGDFDPFTSLRQQMDQLFDDFGRGWPVSSSEAVKSAGTFLIPKVDIAETDKGLEMTVELPGFKQEDVSLDIHEGVLTVKAEHKEEKEEKDEKKHYHLIERRTGSFMRRFALPFTPDADKAAAQLENGLLKVTVPRLEKTEAKPQSIKIEGK